MRPSNTRLDQPVDHVLPPSPSTRSATTRDLGAVVQMVSDRRRIYEEFQPVFWRRAPDSTQIALRFLESQIGMDGVHFLVAEEDDEILGFLIASKMRTPPVYDPGGSTYQIDDFCVRDASLWRTVGATLLDEVRRLLADTDAAQIVVVCGDRDRAKADFLASEGLTVASNWWTQPLAD